MRVLQEQNIIENLEFMPLDRLQKQLDKLRTIENLHLFGMDQSANTSLKNLVKREIRLIEQVITNKKPIKNLQL